MKDKDIYISNTTDKELGDTLKASNVFIFSKYNYSKKIKHQKFLSLDKPLFLYNQKNKSKTKLETLEASLMVIKREDKLDILVELNDITAKDLVKQSLVLIN